MSYTSYVSLIPLLPLAGFVVIGLWGKKYLSKVSGIIGTLILLTITALSFVTAYQYFFVDGKANDVYQPIIAFDYTWLRFSDNLSIDMGIILDPISVMMLVVVGFVSLMVHIFSLGYMKGEERFATYYAFLSLFTFSMLGLVLSTNIFQIYIFWELVGVSSYLLIGFYYDKPSAVAASKKAFIVTRFADLGFLIGILILAFHAETLDFHTLIERLTDASSHQYLTAATTSLFGVSALTWGLTLIFIGGAGKSAMFPLHIWLPDAMEGPTPVSALIHAATMVVAGVYLVARLFPVFSFDGVALDIVGYVGAFSAIFAAVIACTQTDIKRVLAYSTMSQIGYMMFALGVARTDSENSLGFTASMFHLFTHAFFKSLLFLCAGAIIHLVHSNDMKDMGGLRKLMPVTHICFLIACLAIAGIPPFAGFFSKEEILTAAYQSNKLIYFVGLFTSALTAFYMFRLYFSIFWNKEPHVHESHHGEGTMSMKLPLILLATGTVLVGFIHFGSFVTDDGKPVETQIDIIFSITPVVLAAVAIFIASSLYKTANDRPEKIANAISLLYRAAYKKFYIDEIYLFITKKILFNLVGKPAAWIDKNIVDGLMNLIAAITAKISAAIKRLQSGKVQNYALYFFAGVSGLAVVFIWWWK
ncbi:NADH-quinone oxidoreductase subunit L [Panacibacter ginsenosidivorans]|uniref:NADH-quinone oxidoreductase subunit L n=1 Tax=Panacibacter ginsenosidivorans TaxID=1813871 RepID=A0A5B8V6R3_9BACT|nr:NADH-quinone oxidoreductase subunit L [Panacibacter ginsenosidivorans]QEC66441.1 NADH-quinone oxidoreductase subunit L [Panacibacter ginsenosidivorans]